MHFFAFTTRKSSIQGSRHRPEEDLADPAVRHTIVVDHRRAALGVVDGDHPVDAPGGGGVREGRGGDEAGDGQGGVFCS